MFTVQHTHTHRTSHDTNIIPPQAGPCRQSSSIPSAGQRLDGVGNRHLKAMDMQAELAQWVETFSFTELQRFRVAALLNQDSNQPRLWRESATMVTRTRQVLCRHWLSKFNTDQSETNLFPPRLSSTSSLSYVSIQVREELWNICNVSHPLVSYHTHVWSALGAALHHCQSSKWWAVTMYFWKPTLYPLQLTNSIQHCHHSRKDPAQNIEAIKDIKTT